MTWTKGVSVLSSFSGSVRKVVASHRSFLALVFLLIVMPLRAEESYLRILAVHYPPYEFQNPVDGLKGFDVEVVEEAFRRMGREARVEFMPWQRALETAYAGEVMAVLSCAKNKARDPHLLYSNPISASTAGYFMRREMKDPVHRTLSELRGEKVAAVLGYSTQQELVQLDIDHVAVRSNQLGLKMLLVGERVDYYYGSREANQFIAKQLGYQGRFRFRALQKNDFHLCFSKKWPRAKGLMESFNQALQQMKDDGSYQKIHQRYR